MLVSKHQNHELQQHDSKKEYATLDDILKEGFSPIGKIDKRFVLAKCTSYSGSYAYILVELNNDGKIIQLNGLNRGTLV